MTLEFLRKRFLFLDFFFSINMIPHCHPNSRDHYSNKLEFTLLHYSWGFFHTSYSFFRQIIFEKIFSIYSYVESHPHYGPTLLPRFEYLEWITNGSRFEHLNLHDLRMFWQKLFLRRRFLINANKFSIIFNYFLL